MPRLPTADDLGASPSLDSKRPVATFDATPLAKGAGAFASGVTKLGDAILNVGLDRAARDQANEQTLEEAHAQADLLTDLAGRKRAIADAGDPNGLEQAQREAAQARVNEIAGSIKDPARAKLFSERARVQIDALGGLAKARADELTRDSDLATSNEKLSVLAKTAQQDKDLGNKEGYIDAGTAIIDGLAAKGYITAVEAQARKQKFAQDYSFEAVNALNPLQRIAVARGGAEGALIQRESSGNFRVVNPLGYAGLYQFGAPLLSTLGLYKPGANEDLSTWKDTEKDAPGKWSGSFNIPGFPGVRTLADFRESPEAQRAAYQASTAYYDKEIDRRGLGQFIGKDLGNGVKLTREGIYTAAHLGGIAGVDQALRGGRNSADQNGSTVLEYARMGSRAGPGAGDPNEQSIAKYLSADQRARLVNGGTRDLVQQERAAQNAQANEVSTVKSLMQDDEASILRQGAPLQTISPERVSAALGPAAAEQFAQNRAQAVQYHDATNDWSQIPLEQIRARLGTLRPAPGSQGYENADKLFSLAEKQANAIAKERRTDPAAAADKMPEVRAALDGASLDKPESYQAVAKARAIAQDRLGIPEDLRVPMTRAEAQQVAKPLTLASQGGDLKEIKDTLSETLVQLKAAFGDQADTAFQQVLREAHGGRQTAEAASIVLRKLARGDMPTQAEARAVDEAVKTTAADRATASVAPPADASVQVDPETGRPVADIGYPSAARPTFPTPDPGAIDMLRKKPGLSAQFDKTYGPGSAQRVLAITGGR